MDRSSQVFVAALSLCALAGCQSGKPVSAECPSLLPHWATPSTGQPVHLVNNHIGLRGRQILWNGVAIDEPRMVNYLRQVRRQAPTPFVTFDPQGGADCGFARRIRDRIDDVYGCQAYDNICGQGAPDDWRRARFLVTGGPPA